MADTADVGVPPNLRGGRGSYDAPAGAGKPFKPKQPKITPLELTVRQLTGQTLPVRADTTDSVLELKVQIQTLTGLEPDAQCLVVEGGDGIALDLDHVTLGSCAGFKNGAMVHLTMQDASRHRREREQREASKAAAEAAAERARQAEEQAEEKAQKLSQIIAIGCVMMMGGGLIQLVGMWTLIGGWVMGLTGLVGIIIQVWGWGLYMNYATRSKDALLCLGNLYVYAAAVGSIIGTFSCDLASADKTWNERRMATGWNENPTGPLSSPNPQHYCGFVSGRRDFRSDMSESSAPVGSACNPSGGTAYWGGCTMEDCVTLDDCVAHCDACLQCTAVRWNGGGGGGGQRCHLQGGTRAVTPSMLNPSHTSSWEFYVNVRVEGCSAPPNRTGCSGCGGPHAAAVGHNVSGYTLYKTGGCIGRNELGSDARTLHECADACTSDPACVSFEYDKESVEWRAPTCQRSSSCNEFNMTVQDINDHMIWYLRDDTPPPPAGELWTLMLRQTAGLYQSAADWVNYPGDGPDGDNYSVLNTLESCRDTDGFLYMKIAYPGMDGAPQNTWRQTNNPVTDTTAHGGVTGYEAIDIQMTANTIGGWGTDDGNFYGLERGQDDSLLDASVDHGHWFYAVGSAQEWSGGIPGPGDFSVQVVELYACCSGGCEAAFPGPWSTGTPIPPPPPPPSMDPLYADDQDPDTGACVAVPFFAGYSTLIYLIAWCYILLEIRIRRKEIAALATAAAADSKTAAESHAAAGAKRGETELAATNP